MPAGIAEGFARAATGRAAGSYGWRIDGRLNDAFEAVLENTGTLADLCRRGARVLAERCYGPNGSDRPA